MTRRKNRYNRRALERQKSKAQFLSNYDNFENVASYTALYEAARLASRGVAWKASVQRYLLNILINTAKIRADLLAGKDVRQGFICFDVNERGKVRHIRSVHFPERVVQKSLCNNVLMPALSHNLIMDNGASQKGKGTKFALDRLVQHLRWHYRRYGKEGYILLIDFKSYFDNINHSILKEYYRQYFKDEKILKLTDDFVDAFGEKGLGLGSETSQIHAIAYPNTIDHFIKDQCGVKCYGRYMDDSYIISDSKEFLLNLFEKLKAKYTELDITVSPKKTFIADLKHGFTFLKTRFYITDTGKILKRPCRKAVTRERRKIKRQLKLYREGSLSAKDILTSFVSWSGSVKHKNAYKTVTEMKKLLEVLDDES